MLFYFFPLFFDWWRIIIYEHQWICGISCKASIVWVYDTLDVNTVRYNAHDEIHSPWRVWWKGGNVILFIDFWFMECVCGKNLHNSWEWALFLFFILRVSEASHTVCVEWIRLLLHRIYMHITHISILYIRIVHSLCLLLFLPHPIWFVAVLLLFSMFLLLGKVEKLKMFNVRFTHSHFQMKFITWIYYWGQWKDGQKKESR